METRAIRFGPAVRCPWVGTCGSTVPVGDRDGTGLGQVALAWGQRPPSTRADGVQLPSQPIDPLGGLRRRSCTVLSTPYRRRVRRLRGEPVLRRW
jgi:hypothetical protein